LIEAIEIIAYDVCVIAKEITQDQDVEFRRRHVRSLILTSTLRCLAAQRCQVDQFRGHFFGRVLERAPDRLAEVELRGGFPAQWIFDESCPAIGAKIEAELAGKIIRVLDPISLLACKLDLLTTVSQEQRRDLEHIRILIPCIRAFLREFLKQVEQDQLPVKGWLGATNQVLKLTTSSRSRKVTRRFKLDWSEILPLKEIDRSTHEKIVRFRELQLHR
jgi:hypothetical protein